MTAPTTKARRHVTAAVTKQLIAALKPLAGIPIEEFGYKPDHAGRPLMRWSGHALYVGDVLAARAAIAFLERSHETHDTDGC